MSKYFQAPLWAKKITLDLALKGVSAPIQAELRRLGCITVDLAWRRISAAARKELTQWWEDL